MRGFILAVQFLTRIPTPRLKTFHPRDLARSAIWFPAVGLVIGAILASAGWALDQFPLLAGFVVMGLWVWITGALHLDGLADVADGFGAAHRSPERFLAVLKDPHIGTFGVVALVLQLAAKLVLGAQLVQTQFLWALVLIPAWARWAALVWNHTVPALETSALKEQFTHYTRWWFIIAWALILSAVSVLLCPALLSTIAFAVLGTAYWRWRLGGMNGDCLGASIEILETALIAAALGATAMS